MPESFAISAFGFQISDFGLAPRRPMRARIQAKK
jgi:hypothetical protein